MMNRALPDVRFATVADVMTTEVVLVDGNATVSDAIKLMRAEVVSSLVVDRRTHEDAWGIITRKDVVNKMVDPGKDPQEVKVFEIMTKPVIMISPGLALKYCARLLHNTGIRRAPVFDGTQIVGIVSNTDIFDAIKV